MSWDLSQTANDLLARLGAANWTDLNWCTQSEVYSWLDEAAQRLGELGLFVQQNSQTLTPGTAQYPLSANWLQTIHASASGSLLRAASAEELEALDSEWTVTQCVTGEPSSRYALDAGPLGTITLYPQPADADTLSTIDQVSPATVTYLQTLIPAPPPVSDYCFYFALMRARGKESPNAMPEIAAHAADRVKHLEQVLAIFGGKQ